MPVAVGHDPNGTAYAFNATRAQFDLYTLGSAVTTGTAPPTPVSDTFNNSQTGAGVPGTSFNVTIPSGTSATENVTWNKIIVPKGNVSSTLYLRFDWRGSVGNSTKASYFVYNMTGHPYFSHFFSQNRTSTISGGPPEAFVGSPPVGCGPNDNCIDVTRYIGFNLTLTFRFDSNSTGKGLNFNMNNIALVSADSSTFSTSSHSMQLNPADSTDVNHKAHLLIPLGYFANVTYPKPNGQSGTLNHTWAQMILSFYYPSSYTQVKISQNGTSIFPTVAPVSPISQGNCPTFFVCRKDTHAVSLNMTSGIKNPFIFISADSVNLGAEVKTTLGGVPTMSWGPGDLLQVRVVLRAGVNVTGDDYVSANNTGVSRVTQKFSGTRQGTSLLNFTSPIPQDPALLGPWTVNSTYTNGYDFGYNSTSFNLQQLGVNGFSYSGSNQRLNVQGTLTYSPTSPSSFPVNGYVFAIDGSAGPAPLTTTTISTGTGVYVSNISLINGVFTSGQSLLTTFTLVNSAYAANYAGTKMNATLTIDHEYTSGVTHGSSKTIPVPSGYDTFTIHPSYEFELNATFTPAGVRIVVTGITAGGTPVSAILPPGNPPVTSLRQHAGLFRITVTSQPISGTGACVPSCTSSLESPPYAYVLVNPPNPGRLLAFGGFSSGTSGAYSTTISSGRVLGATKLVFLTLGIDSTGLAVTVQGQSSQESTLLQSTLDGIPPATQNQPVSLVLHVRSNSTTVNMNITITLNLQDSTGAIKASQSVSDVLIPPGQTKDVPFNFNAPASVGAYTLNFVSPDYGAPLISGTLQVSVLQSTLQVLVPAIIGVAAAIVILLFFLIRKKPTASPEPTTKDKPASGKPKSGTGTPPRNP